MLYMLKQLQLWLFLFSDDYFKESNTTLYEMERQKFSLDYDCIKTYILTLFFEEEF